MAVFYVQAASMLKSWPTKASSGWEAAHLLTLAALIIFYDGPCAIKYVHRARTHVMPVEHTCTKAQQA
jgi:hypothetical protein